MHASTAPASSVCRGADRDRPQCVNCCSARSSVCPRAHFLEQRARGQPNLGLPWIRLKGRRALGRPGSGLGHLGFDIHDARDGVLGELLPEAPSHGTKRMDERPPVPHTGEALRDVKAGRQHIRGTADRWTARFTQLDSRNGAGYFRLLETNLMGSPSVLAGTDGLKDAMRWGTRPIDLVRRTPRQCTPTAPTHPREF